MPIKSVLTYMNEAPLSGAHLDAAIATARRFEAHLSVAAVAFEPEISPGANGEFFGFSLVAELRERANREAQDLVRHIEKRLAAEDIGGDAFPLVVGPGGLFHAFGTQARYADLVVLAQPADGDPFQALQATRNGAWFHGDAAVLVCPEPPKRVTTRAMIAWDESPSALRSIRRAHAFLVDAEEVDIVMIDAPLARMRSAESLALLLSRYGVQASITRAQSDGRSDAEALKRHQMETGADLTIAGAYAHSRFREFLLGGVTRDLPEMTATPLLMAH